eukprot:1161531-Pelagomonas_calceolata.AAC.9
MLHAPASHGGVTHMLHSWWGPGKLANQGMCPDCTQTDLENRGVQFLGAAGWVAGSHCNERLLALYMWHSQMHVALSNLYGLYGTLLRLALHVACGSLHVAFGIL